MWRFFNRRLEEVLGAAMLAVMVTVTFVNVIVRYCTTFSFAWTEEITINFFVWVVLLISNNVFEVIYSPFIRYSFNIIRICVISQENNSLVLIAVNGILPKVPTMDIRYN